MPKLPGPRQRDEPLDWTFPRERAAIMLAEGSLTDAVICKEVGFSPATLSVLKKHPEFAAHVQEIEDRLEAEAMRLAIARRRERIKRLNDHWLRTQALINARAEEHAHIPGGDTGLLVRTEKVIGFGKNATSIYEYAYDRAPLAELRALEQQAAKELGQWVDRKDLTSDGSAVKAYIAVDIDAV